MKSLLVLGGLTLILVAGTQNPVQAKDPVPQEVVEFLQYAYPRYFVAGASAAVFAKKNPELFTTAFQKFVAANQNKVNYDLLVCAQDLPTNHDITVTAKSAGLGATARVVMHYDKLHTIRVGVQKTNGRWQINEVICGEIQAQ